MLQTDCSKRPEGVASASEVDMAVGIQRKAGVSVSPSSEVDLLDVKVFYNDGNDSK
jgi:hypothetical protein